MVSILIFRSRPGENGYDVLASAKVEDGELVAEGRRPDLVDKGRAIYSERLDKTIRFDEDPEEWLRSFAESFRTAQVGALIAEDTERPDLVAPRDALNAIREPSHAR